MYCRVTRTQASPDGTDERLQLWQSEMLPAMKQAEGFAGATVLVDRQTGESLSVAYWESEQAMKGALETVMPVGRKFLEKAGAQMKEQEEFEVAVLERIQPPKTGVMARINTLQGKPEQVDTAVQAFKNRVVPVLHGQQGIRTAYCFVNRQTGKTMAGSIWDTAEDLERSESAVVDLREETARSAGATNPKVEKMEIVYTEILARAGATG